MRTSPPSGDVDERGDEAGVRPVPGGGRCHREEGCLVLRFRMGAETTTQETWVGDLYEDLRPLMFAIAYRMLGSVTDAEDVVQEAFLRFHRETKAGASIDSPKAYLSAVTTRLGIDHLRTIPSLVVTAEDRKSTR